MAADICWPEIIDAHLNHVIAVAIEDARRDGLRDTVQNGHAIAAVLTIDPTIPVPEIMSMVSRFRRH